LTGGADLSVDSAGGEHFQALVSVAKSGSRIVSYGATRGSVPNLRPAGPMPKQLDIRGTYMGTPVEFQQMLDFIKKHDIHPVLDKKFALKDAIKAQKYMESGQQFGKIILEIPQ
jgi:zinc-binding alcohol dehydrogenase/oxidoreductase